MPDLKTDWMTLQEFKDAIDGRPGTLILFDVNGIGAEAIKGARETGEWQYGDWLFVLLVEWCNPFLADGEVAGRVGGDLFAIHTQGDAVRVDDWKNRLANSPVPVKVGVAAGFLEAHQDMEHRHITRKHAPRTFHGNR